MKYLSNLPISIKITGSFALVALIAAFSGYTSLTSLKKVDEQYTIMQKSMTEPLSTLAEMSKLLQRERINLRDVILANTPEGRQGYAELLVGIRAQMDSLGQDFEQTILTDEMRDAYEAYQSAYLAFEPYSLSIEERAHAGDVEGAEAILQAEGHNTVKAVEARLDALVGMKKRNAETLSEENSALTVQIIKRTTAILVFTLILALGLGVLLTRLVVRPVKTLEATANRVSAGDLEATVTVKGQDELGRLGAGFNAMVASIRSAMEAADESRHSAENALHAADAARQASDAQSAYLAGSVDAMLAQMRRFAEGDLTAHLTAEHDDEIGRLFTGFNESVENIRAMIVAVEQSVASAASAALQIRASTEGLAASTHEQSAQASEVATAVEQMVQTIAENSRSATETTDMARESGQIAREGGEVVQQTVGKMREIATVVQACAASVEALGTSSAQIGAIIEVIDDIAGQTNLLALNATIEAARAGEHGKGFAVVADEVRKLAERTATATQQIAQMIGGIQQGTRTAVEAMQRGDAEVRAGMHLATEAGTALERTVAGAENTMRLIGQIAAASEEQSVTSEQISRNVESISSVSHESACDVSQIAESAEGLTRLTGELSVLIARFQTAPARPSAWGDGSTSAAPRLASVRA